MRFLFQLGTEIEKENRLNLFYWLMEVRCTIRFRSVCHRFHDCVVRDFGSNSARKADKIGYLVKLVSPVNGNRIYDVRFGSVQVLRFLFL